MSHCRWVVISEDCYQQLGESSQKGKEEAPVSVVQQTDDIAESVTVPKVTKEAEPETVRVPTPSKKDTEVKEPVDWTATVPPSFKKEADNLLKKLVEIQGFRLDPRGIIQIDGISLEDYSIREFLRTACIPFNKTNVPILFQDWLRVQGITTFRNHLFKILPKWQNQYSWRESTMAVRKGPSEAQKPSTRKRKS